MGFFTDLIIDPAESVTTRGDDVVFTLTYDPAFAGTYLSYRMTAPDEFSSYFTFYGGLYDDGAYVYTNWVNVLLDDSGSLTLEIPTNPRSYESEWMIQLKYDGTYWIRASTTVIINDYTPVAVDTANIAVSEDASVSGFLAEGTDTDGNTLTYALGLSEPLHGSVSLASNGQYVYTPEENFSGADSFSYIVTDGKFESQEATAFLTVTPANDSPTGDIYFVNRTYSEPSVWTGLEGSWLTPQIVTHSSSSYSLVALTTPDQDRRLVAKLASGEIINLDDTSQYSEGASANVLGYSVDSFSDGSWIVVWCTADAVYGQKLSASGDRDGQQLQLNTFSAERFSELISVKVLDDDSWFVSWNAVNSELTPFTTTIHSRQYAFDLTATTLSEFELSNPPENQYVPASVQDAMSNGAQVATKVSSLQGGGWVVSWYGADGNGYNDVYVQQYSAQGEVLGDVITVNTYTEGHQYNQDITALPNGGWLVTWETRRSDGDSYDIFAREFLSDGTPVSDEYEINQDKAGAQWSSDVVSLSDSEYVVAWETYLDGVTIIEHQVFSSAPKQGDVITASTESLADIDGLGAFSFQWFADDEPIIDAETRSLALTQEQVGKRLSVIVSYTDSQGFQENISSPLTSPIINVNDQPVVSPTEYFLDGANSFNDDLPFATDLDGDSITYHLGDLTGVKGSVALSSDGNFTYTQNSVGAFDDAFTVRAFDGELYSEEVYMTLRAPELLSVHAPDGSQLTTGNISIDGESATLNWVNGQIAIRADEVSPLSLKLGLEDSNSITISDVIAQLRHIVGLDALTGLPVINADVDGDGTVGISDVIGNLRVIVGLEEQTPSRVVSTEGSFELDPSDLPAYVEVSVVGDVDLSASFLDLV